jgi:hypothetical protein
MALELLQLPPAVRELVAERDQGPLSERWTGHRPTCSGAGQRFGGEQRDPARHRRRGDLVAVRERGLCGRAEPRQFSVGIGPAGAGLVGFLWGRPQDLFFRPA